MKCAACDLVFDDGCNFCCKCGARLTGNDAKHSGLSPPADVPVKRRRIFHPLKDALILAAILGFNFILSVTVMNMISASHRAKVRRTMADMYSLTTAWEAYAVDHDTYCPNVNFTRPYKWGNLDPATLQRMLSPKYIRKMPLKDAWGRPLQFAVSCNGEQGMNFAVRSAGVDGIWATDKHLRKKGEFFDYDIVYANGCFIKSPRGYCDP